MLVSRSAELFEYILMIVAACNEIGSFDSEALYTGRLGTEKAKPERSLTASFKKA